MTTFFDKKEDVLDLQLTPYGEALLSVGELKPVYYAFFDDDILYDGFGAAGLSEEQNDIEPRIQENTPNIKVQTVFSGIESNLVPLIRSMGYTYEVVTDPVTGWSYAPYDSFRLTPERAYDPIPPNIDNNFTLIEPLGTMQLGSENAPAWNIKTLKGELSGAINYLTSSREAGVFADVRRVPQLDFDIKYRVVVGHTSLIDVNGPIREQSRLMSRVYEDGSFLYLSEEAPNLILVVDEENTSIDLDYDMEIFLIEDGAPSDQTPTLTPKYFLQPTEQVVGDILLDEPLGARSLRLDPSFAEYFFLVNTDREIPAEEICPVLGGLETRGITLNDIPYDCPDVERSGRFDIYGTNVGAEEPCDD